MPCKVAPSKESVWNAVTLLEGKGKKKKIKKTLKEALSKNGVL